jgi:SAM-dependent methyltransferase
LGYKHAMKRHAPAAERNTAPILAALAEPLAMARDLLEIASGTGQHALAIARAMPKLAVQPSDVDAQALASIAAYRDEALLPNLKPPTRVDVCEPNWGTAADVILCINMIHIAPWSATLGLLEGAGRLLTEGGRLMLYGPYRFDGRFTAASNATFDASLRHQDPSWGVRDLSDVTREAEDVGLVRSDVVDMPANNHLVVFQRAQ